MCWIHSRTSSRFRIGDEKTALFPLGEAWRQRFIGDRIDIRPRDAVNWAREGWRQQQESLARHDPLDWLRRWPKDSDPGPGRPDEPTTEEITAAIDRKIAERLASLSEQLEREPHTLPADADHLAGLVYSLLAQCRDAGHLYGVWEVERRGPAEECSTHLSPVAAPPRCRDGRRSSHRRSVSGGTQCHLGSWFPAPLAGELGAFDRIVLVTAERIGLPLGQAGREYLEALQQRGPQHFQILERTFAEWVELEALYSALSDWPGRAIWRSSRVPDAAAALASKR